MKNVIIILCDTLRAKSLPHYGCIRNTIPNLAPIIDSDFVVYNKAYASAPWTIPSHLSLFTGLYPSQVMKTPTSLQLSPNFTTLPRLFKDSGYKTTGISTNALVSRKFNFNKDFDSFFQLWLPDEKSDDIYPDRGETSKFKRLLKLINAPGGPGNLWKFYNQRKFKERFNIIKDATHSTNRAFDLLKKTIHQNRAEKEFYFVNAMQAHEKFNPPIQTRNTFVKNNSVFELFYKNRSVLDHYAVEPFSEEILKYLELRYEEEILYLDKVISDFIDYLKNNNFYDSSTIVITSDHGEHFGENGHFTHWFSVYESAIKIPMYIKWPGKAENNMKQNDQLVVLHDLYSTFSNLLNYWEPCPDSSIDLTSQDKRPFIISQLPSMAYTEEGCKKKNSNFSLSDLGLENDSLNAYVFNDGMKIIEHGGSLLGYNLLDDPDEKSPQKVNKEIVDTIKSELLD